jgi:hypothetical protein
MIQKTVGKKKFDAEQAFLKQQIHITRLERKIDKLKAEQKPSTKEKKHQTNEG